MKSLTLCSLCLKRGTFGEHKWDEFVAVSLRTGFLESVAFGWNTFSPTTSLRLRRSMVSTQNSTLHENKLHSKVESKLQAGPPFTITETVHVSQPKRDFLMARGDLNDRIASCHSFLSLCGPVSVSSMESHDATRDHCVQHSGPDMKSVGVSATFTHISII